MEPGTAFLRDYSGQSSALITHSDDWLCPRWIGAPSHPQELLAQPLQAHHRPVLARWDSFRAASGPERIFYLHRRILRFGAASPAPWVGPWRLSDVRDCCEGGSARIFLDRGQFLPADRSSRPAMAQ